VSLGKFDTHNIFNNSLNGILHYRSVGVVNLPVGKPTKRSVVRSRYPTGEIALATTPIKQ
jgi:hypothetical protein